MTLVYGEQSVPFSSKKVVTVECCHEVMVNFISLLHVVDNFGSSYVQILWWVHYFLKFMAPLMFKVLSVKFKHQVGNSLPGCIICGEKGECMCYWALWTFPTLDIIKCHENPTYSLVDSMSQTDGDVCVLSIRHFFFIFVKNLKTVFTTRCAWQEEWTVLEQLELLRSTAFRFPHSELTSCICPALL